MSEENLDEKIYLKDGAHRLPTEHSNIKIILESGKEIIYNFTKYVDTNPTTISYEAIQMPSIRHFTGNLLAEAEKEVEVTKLVMSKYSSQVRSQIRNKHPKLTDKDKDDLLNQDETLYKLKRKLIDQQEKVNKLWSVISGLKYKKDMLQTVSSNLRSLMNKSDVGLNDVALNALKEFNEKGAEATMNLVDKALSSKI